MQVYTERAMSNVSLSAEDNDVGPYPCPASGLVLTHIGGSSGETLSERTRYVTSSMEERDKWDGGGERQFSNNIWMTNLHR